jgi:diguanylate cyclase (GGDEF)-like protein
LTRANRTGHPFSFAIVSVDRYESMTKQHGNTVGEHVLKTLAEQVMQLLRVLDSFGRISEHEFGVILPTTWLDQSGKVVDRINKAIASVDWAAIAPAMDVTLSSGITTNAANDTCEAMLGRARQALKEAHAKGHGKMAQVEAPLPEFDAGSL